MFETKVNPILLGSSVFNHTTSQAAVPAIHSTCEYIQIMTLLKHIKVSEQNHLWFLLILQYFGAFKSAQFEDNFTYKAVMTL